MKAIFYRLSALLERPSRSQFLWAVFVGAFVIRIVIVFAFGNWHHPQMYEHGDIAHNLYTGHGFAMHWPYESLDSARRYMIANLPPDHEGAFIPPLNPYLIYGSYLIFGQTPKAVLALMIFYALISSLVPLVTFQASRLLASETAARYTAVLSMIFIPAAYAVITFSGAPLYHILGITIVYVALLLSRTIQYKYAVLLGLLCGLMTMVRSEFLILGMIVIAITSFITKKRSFSDKLKVALVSACCAVFMIAPWTLRNYSLFGKVVPVLSHPWYEIWRGNNEYVAASSLTDKPTYIWIDPRLFPSVVRQMDALAYDVQFETKVNEIFKAETIAFTSAHLGSTAYLALKKILFLFTFDFSDKNAYHPVNILFSLLLTGCIVAGFFSISGLDRTTKWLFLSLFIYYLGITISTFVLPRYQSYIQTLLLPIAALAFNSLPSPTLREQS